MLILSMINVQMLAPTDALLNIILNISLLYLGGHPNVPEELPSQNSVYILYRLVSSQNYCRTRTYITNYANKL